MCHADTHPFFFATKRNIIKGFVVLFVLQLLCIFYVVYYNQKSVSTFNTSLAIYPYDFKSLKLFVADPLLKTQNHISNYDIYKLKDTSTIKDYFSSIRGDVVCYTRGTNISASWNEKRCVCDRNYFGRDCGIPSVIWNTGNNSQILPPILKRRSLPRRMVLGVSLDDEFEMFEARMAMQYDVVDVFILHEGNVSIYGVPKEPKFLNRFQAGWLKQCQDKFVYVYQSSVLEKNFKTTYDARSSLKNYLGKTAFLRRLTDLRPDDLFVYSDPEELIRPEVLLFLKLYNGYTEPVSFQFRRAVFGYFWTVEEEAFGPHHILLPVEKLNPSAASLALFGDFYHYDASFPGYIGNQSDTLDNSNKQNSVQSKQFEIAKEDFENRNDVHIELFKLTDDAGWKCLWCYKPENIRSKLLSIPPKYLDMVSLMIQEHSELENIRGFIKYGIYFDKAFMRGGKGTELTKSQDKEFAPNYIQDDPNRFSYLLTNPYSRSPETIIEAHLLNATSAGNNTVGNYTIVGALDNKIKKYWYSLFDNATSNINNTLADKIDLKLKSYMNSVRNKFLPSYIKWTQ